MPAQGAGAEEPHSPHLHTDALEQAPELQYMISEQQSMSSEAVHAEEQLDEEQTMPTSAVHAELQQYDK